MTDCEKMKKLFTEFGIGFKEETLCGRPTLICSEGSAKVVGYSNFLTEFRFNPDGSFVEMGSWEH
jgi:hypothetical protein